MLGQRGHAAVFDVDGFSPCAEPEYRTWHDDNDDPASGTFTVPGDLPGDRYWFGFARLFVDIEVEGDDRYVDGIIQVTRAVTDAFERWPDLDSLDVCQERHPSDPQRDRQLTVTQIELTRDTAATIDWDTVTLAELLITLDDDPDSFLRISNDLAAHPAVRSAVAELRETTGWAATTTGEGCPS